MKRAALRWARRLLVAAACAGLLAALVHTPWARGLVLRQVTSALSARSSFVYSADALDYSLFGLTVEVEGLRISRRGSDAPPLLYVKRAEAAFSRRVFAGLVEVDRLDADGLALVIDLEPRAGDRPEADRPFRVPSFTIGNARLRHATIEVIDPDGLGHLRVRDVALDAAGGGPRRLTASFVVEGGLTLDSDETRVRVDRIDGRAWLDGDTIGVMPSSASAGSRRLDLDGKVTFTGPSPAFDLGLAGAADIALVTSWFPALPPGNGLLELTGRATGPLNDPQFTFTARSAGIMLPDIRVPASAAEGRISRAGIYIDRMRAGIGEGRVDVSGRLPLGPDDRTSRVSLTWVDVPVAGLAKVFDGLPEDPIGMVLSGSARLRWPGTMLRFETLEGDVEADVRFAPSLPPARARFTASSGRWTLRTTQDFDGGSIASLEAAIAVDSDDVLESRIAGALRASSADLRADLAAIRRGFPGLPDVSAWLSEGQMSLDSTIDGTLGDPRLTGTARSERMRIEFLPRMKAVAEFEITPSRLVLSEAVADDGAGNRVDGRAAVDFGAGATEGAFTARVTNPEPILITLLRTNQGSVDEALEASGLLTLTGNWNGPLNDPVLAMTLEADGVSVTSSSFGVERAAAEGRLDGLLSNPEARLRVSAAAVRAGSLAPVAADAQLSLASGRLDVRARVPDWSASLDGRIAADAPHAFTATLSVADLAAERVVALLDADASDWTAGGSMSATLDAGGDFDSRRVRVGGRADLAGGTFQAGKSRFVDAMNASVEIRDGRLWLTRAAGLAFAGPLSASGDVPLNWVEEYLPAGWRLSDVPPDPRAAAFEVRAEPDVKTLGAWLRPDEPGRMTGALRLRATGTASTPSLAALDGRLIVEPDVVRVRDVAFALPRAAEIRIKDGRAAAENVTITAPGTTVSLSGTMALEGDRALDARIAASGALGFLSSLVPGRVAGEFKADLRASGTIADPGLTGTLSLDGAAWLWPEQRMALRDWSGLAVVNTEAVTIDALNGHLSGGDASISGEIRFGGGGRGLRLQVRDAFAEVVKGLRSQANADLTLASAGEGAKLSGTVTVTSGAYREPITAMARLFASAPEAAAKPDQGPSPLDAVVLDVELTAASPVVIENSAGRLDLVPAIKLQGTLAEPALFGSLDMVDEGRLTLFGRTFRLSEASVMFAGTNDPTVRLIGESRVGDYDVTLRTSTPVSRLEPTFTSEPPLSQRDLQSLLVTGRTTDTADTKGSSDEDFALGAASSDLLGFAGQMVGLDSVQLGRADFELGASDVDPAMRLTASKRLTGRTRLILSQDLDNNKLTWIVVFAPKRGYEIRVSQRDNLEEVIEFRQELSFGPGVSPPTAPGFRQRARGPRVASVEFLGDLRYPVPDLQAVLRLTAGKSFDAGRWQEDRTRLEEYYRTRGFAVARIVPNRTIVQDEGTERLRLSYRVDPGPRTILRVNGIDLSDDDRRALMRVWSGSVLPEFLDDDITGFLRGRLAQRGYLRPTIAVTVNASDPDVIHTDVTVTPGPITGARTLVLEGTRGVSERELREALSGNPALDSAWVDPAPLVDAVVALYAQRGYASARVVADELSFEGETAQRRLRVTEGPRSVVADIAVAGAAEARAAGARAAVGLQPGEPLLPGMEADAKRRLERFYLDRGYRAATVRTAATRHDDGRVALSFAVTEGPVSVINDVQVSGAEATKPGVVSGAIALKPGAPAGQRGVDETQTQLYGLGVFRRADVTFEPAAQAQPGGASAPVNMKVSLEEARRFQLRYGLHLSNEYGPVFDDFSSAIGAAADIRDRNFLGRAYTIGVSGRIEKNLQSLRGQFSFPPLFDQRLQTNVYGTFRSETDATDESVTYTQQERDLTFEQRLRLPFRMDVSWGYSYNVRDLSFEFQQPRQLIDLTNTLGYLTGTFVADRRDSPFNASRGWFQSSNLQWGLEALGADIDYVRILLRQFYYRPAGPFVFASGVRWGWLHGLEGVEDIQALRLADQLFDAGGAQTVRGYAEDSLSAYEPYGVPVGGSKLLLLNQEVRFPLFSKWLQGAAFIDAGNTFAPGQPLKLEQLAVGTGFGIRIMTPFAPLRLDVGYPINRRPDDKPYRLYFSIGQIF